MSDGPDIPTHLVTSYGDYETSAALAAVLDHLSRYANGADGIQFTEEGCSTLPSEPSRR